MKKSVSHFCLRDCVEEKDGFLYVKANDLLQFIKKQVKILKSTKAFSQIFNQ